MSDRSAKEHTPHVERVGVYLAVFVALIVLLVLTFIAARFNLDRYVSGLNLGIALTIALAKAVLVILFFMHVKHGTGLVWLFAAAGFFWILILLTLPFTDFANRHHPPAGDALTDRYARSAPFRTP